MQNVDHMYHSDQKSLLRLLRSFALGPESSHSRQSSICSDLVTQLGLAMLPTLFSTPSLSLGESS